MIPFSIDAMLENFKLLPENQSAVMIMRHSIRYPIPPGDAYGYHIGLTADGVAAAQAMGLAIPRPITYATASPLMRCQDTANLLIQDKMTVDAEPLIGAASAYMIDLDPVADYQHTHGPIAMITHLLEHRQLPGFATLKAGSSRLLNTMYERLQHHPGLHLYVTHDSVLAPLVYYICGKNYVNEQLWPAVLESALIYFTEAYVELIWRGQKFCAPRDILFHSEQ